LTYTLMKKGIPLPKVAIHVSEAEEMLANILTKEKNL